MKILKFFIIINLFLLTSAQSYSQDKQKEEIFTRASRYFFQKKFEMAEILLQEVIKKEPENMLAYSYLGDIFLKKKKFDGALNLYMKALDIDPDSAENYFRIGQVYYFKKIGNLSIENYDKAMVKDEKLKIIYYHKGLTYLMIMRDKDMTIENWETFLRIAPEDPQFDRIKRVVELLKDPNFKIPPIGSDISIEEALLLGGATLNKENRKAENRKAGHEDKKTKKKIEDIYIDDDL